MPPLSEPSLSNKQDNIDGVRMQQLSEEEVSGDEDVDYENIVYKQKPPKAVKSKSKAATRKSSRKPVKTEYYECSD